MFERNSDRSTILTFRMVECHAASPPAQPLRVPPSDVAVMPASDDGAKMPPSLPSEGDLSNLVSNTSLSSDEPRLQPLNERAANRLLRSTYSSRSPVQIGFTIYSISRVLPVEQSFDADIRIYCRWFDKMMASDPDMLSLRANGRLAVGTKLPRRQDGNFPDAVVKMIDPDLVSGTRPRYELANAKHVEKVPGSEFIYLSPNDEPGWVTMETRYRGTFQQNFNLLPFPFDVQQICVIVRMSAYPDRGRSFDTFQLKGTGVQQEVKDWIKLAEWVRYEPSCIFESDSRGRARCTIQMLLKRKATYHVQNVMVVNGCITVCSFFGFAIGSDELEERLAVAATMFLTAIAFKIVVANDIPKVNYSTILDRYINGCLVFMFGTMFAMFVIALIERYLFGAVSERSSGELLEAAGDKTSAWWRDYADGVCLLACFGLFGVFHVWVMLLVRQARATSRSALSGLKTATDASNELRTALRLRSVSDYEATHQEGDQTARELEQASCSATDTGGHAQLQKESDANDSPVPRTREGRADNYLSGSFSRGANAQRLRQSKRLGSSSRTQSGSGASRLGSCGSMVVFLKKMEKRSSSHASATETSVGSSRKMPPLPVPKRGVPKVAFTEPQTCALSKADVGPQTSVLDAADAETDNR